MNTYFQDFAALKNFCPKSKNHLFAQFLFSTIWVGRVIYGDFVGLVRLSCLHIFCPKINHFLTNSVNSVLYQKIHNFGLFSPILKFIPFYSIPSLHFRIFLTFSLNFPNFPLEILIKFWPISLKFFDFLKKFTPKFGPSSLKFLVFVFFFFLVEILTQLPAYAYFHLNIPTCFLITFSFHHEILPKMHFGHCDSGIT